MPKEPQPSTPATPAPDTADLAAREAKLAADQQALAADREQLALREQKLKEDEQARNLAAATAFADDLAKQAKIRPADVPAVATILVELDQAEPAACFAAPDDAEHKPRVPGAALRELLSNAEPLVALAEIATKRAAGDPDDNPTDKEIADRAAAYKAKMDRDGIPVSLAAAVDAVTAGKDRAA